MKRCFRNPIPEIYESATLLDKAVDEHLKNNKEKARELIIKANKPEIREWTESIWGAKSPHIEYLTVEKPLPNLKKIERFETRMPDKILKQKMIDRDGYNCVFCGIPLIRSVIRKKIQEQYPNALEWNRRNIEQHSAFQAMWLQYDHLVPHSRGGLNNLNNLVITCAPCNFGRMQYTVEENNLINPFSRERIKSKWDGLERFK